MVGLWLPVNNYRKGDKRSYLCIFLTTCHQTLKKRSRELSHAWHSRALNWSVVLHACCMCMGKEGGNARSVYTAPVCLEKGELFYLSPSVTVFITLSVWVLKPTYLYKYFYFYVLPWTWILKRDRSMYITLKELTSSGLDSLPGTHSTCTKPPWLQWNRAEQADLSACWKCPWKGWRQGGGMMSGCPDQVALPDSAERRLN